jgi:hypothetical protein
VSVKSGATTRRYLGTIRTTGTTTTEDSGGGTTTQVGGKRFVWNLYNQTIRALSVIDTTDSWTYATATWRQANGATGNKVEFVVGLAGGWVQARVVAGAFLNNSSGAASAGVGVDSTTAPSGLRGVAYALSSNGLTIVSTYDGAIPAGYHYLAWIEVGATANTALFLGDNAGTAVQSGLTAVISN